MKPFTSLLARGLLAATVSLGAIVATSTTASAYVACRGHDCWHTDTRIKLPGITLSFHNDNWQKQHEHDKRYNWHEADAGHDYHHGYWDHGTWRAR